MTEINYDDNNIFARILRHELNADVIFENEHVLVFQDKFPQARVHLLAIPKGRYRSFDDFSAHAGQEEIVSFFQAIGDSARHAGLTHGGYRLVSNCGKNAGQEVPHFHMHILGGEALGPIISQHH
ncbi:HIT domain-containing protein [Acetobacteraceae bacterium EV16G]|uniref:HIT domain-containing protein n=1 Tax=Sorlinia euscelidii TaxID=3081148 RepID=A0ABU7U2E2_9PROT